MWPCVPGAVAPVLAVPLLSCAPHPAPTLCPHLVKFRGARDSYVVVFVARHQATLEGPLLGSRPWPCVEGSMGHQAGSRAGRKGSCVLGRSSVFPPSAQRH